MVSFDCLLINRMRKPGHRTAFAFNKCLSLLSEKLAESKGLCFKPSGLDTCPRMVIEAKLLGCELDMNDLVQHNDESWFKGSYDDIVKYLKSRPAFFWEKSFA